MSTVHTRSIHLSEHWLDKLDIALVVVHGRTIVRASESAQRLLKPFSDNLIGRDLVKLLAAPEDESFDAWAKQLYSAELPAPLQLTCQENQLTLRLTGDYVEEGSQSTRIIALQHAPAPLSNQNSDAVAELRRTLKELLDGDPVPTFVVSADHILMHWNRACEAIIGTPAKDIVGTRLQWKPFYAEARPVLADFVIDAVPAEEVAKHYDKTFRPSSIIPDGMEASAFFPNIGRRGRWLLFTAAPIRNAAGNLIGAMQTLVDVTEIKAAEITLRRSQGELEELVRSRTFELQEAKQALEADIRRREQAESDLRAHYAEVTELNTKLSQANAHIQDAKNQLLQNEKLASIGQLAAGVAHEINNPIGYVFSNVGTLEHYLADIMQLIDAYQAAENHVGDDATRQALIGLRTRLDLEFLKEDTIALMRESREGIERVRKIVQDLKDFSHVDASQEWQWADIHKGMESTLNIANNEIKYKAEVERNFGELPQVQCLPSQLNQVFMNLVVNAAHALDGAQMGRIVVRTWHENDEVNISVADNGCGMSADTLSRIFDPFFTTKPVGKGTGLGLSLSYGIVQKHHGRIEVDSEPGKGTTFRVVLPVSQPPLVLEEPRA